MNPFLDRLAQHLHKTHGNGLKRVCIVFPNRRANLFFKQYFSRLIDTPAWLPDMYALEDFVVKLSGLTLGDPLTLIATLYKTYAGLVDDDSRKFADFISWGNMLLADFDEIDQHRTDGNAVFLHLDEAKVLQHWNPGKPELTLFEQNYLKFYNSLAPCYTKFREKLLTDNSAYFGLAFSHVLDKISISDFEKWDKIIFAGFNALTPAEQELITFLNKNGKAETYWDADSYYLNDPDQEAGLFMREYFKKSTFGPVNWIDNALETGEKIIEVLGFPGQTGQAKLAGEICRKYIAEHGSADGLAIVLVDESLLLPMLNSIPENAGNFNVTMGFPLRQTPVFSLINTVINLFVTAARFSKHAESEKSSAVSDLRFYHKEIRRFLSHPYISSLLINTDDAGAASVLPLNAYYTLPELIELIGKSNTEVARLFSEINPDGNIATNGVINLLNNLIGLLYNAKIDETETGRGRNGLDLEYLANASVICSNLKSMFADPALQVGLEQLQNLVNSLMAPVSIPFYGEPLNGLQVMGMLETRLLDFSHLIMISANEGMLPKGKRQQTFIPDDVRSAYGMQQYHERNAVFAYHFYRLLEQAEHAWLIYNSEGNELGGGEKSRFITQILHEMPKKNPNCKIHESIVSIPPSLAIESGLAVSKTPAIVERLLETGRRGISPSALAAYLDCQLKFYYAHVLRIREPDEVGGAINAALFGEIIHEILHLSLQPFEGKVISSIDVGILKAAAEKHTSEAFGKRFTQGELNSGANFLSYRVAKSLVERILLHEATTLTKTGGQLQILKLEHPLEAPVEIILPGKGTAITLKLHGTADRIDRCTKNLRIIDYKTGSVENTELKCENVESVPALRKPGKMIQLLAYAYMLQNSGLGQGTPVETGIIALQKPSEGFMAAVVGGKSELFGNDFDDIAELMRLLFESIYDDRQPFLATDDLKICQRCSYATICNRT